MSRSSRPLPAPPIRRPNEPGLTLPMSASQTISLLPAVSEGNLAAFEQLYDRHSPILYALLLRMLANPEDAQEVLQEAFVKAWNDASRYDPSRGSELAWLISIARSRGIDRIRSRKVRGDREKDAARDNSIRSAAVDGMAAVESAVAGEEQRAVRAALAEIPEAQRQALELAYFDGLSQSEIAEKLGVPLGTIKTRMQLGMRKMRERLRESLDR
jgi:RNA polymerase sigma-70 factor (ECF subfamily)